jgi:hypothetical protein
MQSPNKIIEQVYLMCMARRSMCITLPIILQSFLFITQEEDLGENYLQNPKEQENENDE